MMLSGCPGDLAPGATNGEDGGSSTGGPGITTFNSTVDPSLPEDGGSMGNDSGATTAEGTGSTTDLPGTTTDRPGTTTDQPGTTTTDGGMGSSSGGGMGTSSGGGSSTGPACNDVPGNYENCLGPGGVTDTTPCMAPGDATCLIAGGMPPTAGVCANMDCVDPCDCPAAPMSGDAVVSCSDVTGDPTELFCYLDCGMGETCPTGMICFGGFLCIWPDPGAMGTPYGDCFNNDTSICGLTGTCLNDDVMMPTIGVCTNECMNLGDCDVAPPGGMSPVDCTDVTGDGASECIIDCSGGTTCPTGMTCFGGFLCAWN